MPTLDVTLIKKRLFENPQILAKLVADYGLPAVPEDADALAISLVGVFGQQAADDIPKRTVTNREVFRAAVRTLASNSRSWSTYLKHEAALASLLGDYDPAATQAAINDGRANLTDIKECLPGQTATADAKAILRWVDLLEDVPNYHANVVKLRAPLADLGAEERELLPVIAGLLGTGSNHAAPNALAPPEGLATWKLPGMGPVLTSELLRNLHWSGFKPDRHITRLFRSWFPGVVAECEPRALELAVMIGRRAKDLVEFLTFSLVGLTVTPDGHSYTEIDNLVWAWERTSRRREGNPTPRMAVIDPCRTVPVWRMRPDRSGAVLLL